MGEISLLFDTGHAKIDRVLRDIVGTLETVFPGQFRSHYLSGSYAEGAAVRTSDLDLFVVFKEEPPDAVKRKFGGVTQFISLNCPVEVDITPLAEGAVNEHPSRDKLKEASVLLYGTDIREGIVPPPFEDYVPYAMHGPLAFFARARGNPQVLRTPLAFPDPAAEFYGYDRKKVRTPDGKSWPSTKDLVGSTGWSASALVALLAGRYVCKSDRVRVYRECVNDEWAPLLEEIAAYCRETWEYLIPEGAGDRARLRRLCERALEFENHFLTVYRDYLARRLREADDAGKLLAVKCLGQVDFADAAILESLEELAAGGDGELGPAARQTLRRYAAA